MEILYFFLISFVVLFAMLIASAIVLFKGWTRFVLFVIRTRNEINKLDVSKA